MDDPATNAVGAPLGCVPKITAVARAALEQYLYLLDEAFAGDDWHSLISNLKDLAPEDWLWLPPDGARPIAEMVSHVAACKNMYGNHAFGDASMTWEDPLADQKLLKAASAAGIEQLLRFLKEAHAGLRAQVDALSNDAELMRPRRTNWGDTAETRWIIKATIEHDLYHAGEINRMRALCQANDRWAFEQFT
jgi:DinB family protein